MHILATLIMLAACKNPDKPTETKSSPPASIPVPAKPAYKTFKNSVRENKIRLYGSLDTVTNYLFSLINEELYFYWKGTTWDFNGTTQIPQKGNIACGYFVTNTLTDLGFSIQRVKLAQAPSSEMIKKLCVDIHWFTKFEELQTFLDRQPGKSIYLVGLDFHTGYILKDSLQSYFLHSNYIKKEGVIKERIEESSALRYNKAFMIGSLSSNKRLLEEWVRQ